ncbi:sulfurtransferase complex subunit TusC [Buchnera aphidicola (Ceratovacuna keduensis)]|uniref:sulfurtransferase complex subunit TusC n=1 Tax=Buchnera aphidicola TaxID=9 RepID=UPI0031B83053
MKKIAFLFSKSPYGSSKCQDLLDLSLSTSFYFEEIAFFFVGDGIFQILKNQNPKKIFANNFSKSFSIFELCDISNFYLCKNSLKERGILFEKKFFINSFILSRKLFKNKLNLFEAVINC